MTIAVQCPACQRTFKVDERHAGKVKPCPACKRGEIVIPSADPFESGLPETDPFAQGDFPATSVSTTLPPRKPTSTAASRARRFWIKAGVGGLLGCVVLGAVIYGGIAAWQGLSQIEIASFSGSADGESTAEKKPLTLDERYLTSAPIPEVLAESPIPWLMFRDEWSGFEMAAIADLNLVQKDFRHGTANIFIGDPEHHRRSATSKRTRDVAVLSINYIDSSLPLNPDIYDKLITALGTTMSATDPLTTRMFQVRYELTQINGYYAADLHISGYPGSGQLGGFILFAGNEAGNDREHVMVLYAAPPDFLTPQQIEAMKSTIQQIPSANAKKALERSIESRVKYAAEQGKPVLEVPPPVPRELTFTPIPWTVELGRTTNMQIPVPDLPIHPSTRMPSIPSFGHPDPDSHGGVFFMTTWRNDWFVRSAEAINSDKFVAVVNISAGKDNKRTTDEDIDDLKKAMNFTIGQGKGARAQFTQEPQHFAGAPGLRYRISGLGSLRAEAFGVFHEDRYFLIMVMGHESLLPPEHIDIVLNSFQRYYPAETSIEDDAKGGALRRRQAP